MPSSSSSFDFHGVRVELTTDDAEVLARVENDFSFFRAPGDSRPATPAPPHLRIAAHRRPPAFDRMPPRRASVYTPRNICYADGPRTWMDFFGKALAVYDRDGNTVEAQTTDVHLLTEIVYLTILSRVSELLEERGLHRVHALAIESDGEAALFLMPSGCGKSTLGLGFLRRPGSIRLLSEDSPLVDADGNVHPFPLRIGVVGEIPPGIAAAHVTEQRRMEFAPKRLISLAAFPGRIATDPARARLVYFGHRHTRHGCRATAAGAAATWKELARHLVVGVGLYQGVEFLLQSSVVDLLRMRRRIASRVRAAYALARRADVLDLELGPAPTENLELLLHDLNDRGFARLDDSRALERRAV